MFLQFLRARTIRRLVENLPALKVHLKPDRYIVRLLREHGYTIPFHGKLFINAWKFRLPYQSSHMYIYVTGVASVFLQATHLHQVLLPLLPNSLLLYPRPRTCRILPTSSPLCRGARRSTRSSQISRSTSSASMRQQGTAVTWMDLLRILNNQSKFLPICNSLNPNRIYCNVVNFTAAGLGSRRSQRRSTRE